MFKSFLKYLKIRFPLLPLSIYSLLTMICINRLFGQLQYTKVLILSFIYLQFFFHLRILDEFKDYKYDSTYHSDRPVQKGIISLYFLKIIGIVNLLILLVLSFFVSVPSTIPLLLVSLLYTFFMYKEFFIGEKLRSRIILYLISHEVVFIFLFLYFYSVFQNHLWFSSNISDVCGFIYLLIPIPLIEFGRKIKPRYDSQHRQTDDTYSYHWGEIKTIRLFSLLVLLAGSLSLSINHFQIAYSFFIIIPAFILYFFSKRYKKFIVKQNMPLTVIFTVLLLILFIL
jgi:hypothetical protein